MTDQIKVGSKVRITFWHQSKVAATKNAPEHGTVFWDTEIVRETPTQWVTREGMRFLKEGDWCHHNLTPRIKRIPDGGDTHATEPHVAR